MNSFKTPKGTTLPLLDLKGKSYLQVAHRIQWFREEHPNWCIRTDLRYFEPGKYAVTCATICNEKSEVIATAHKHETMEGFYDFIEKSETGAIGRALALCGYGTQFTDDLEEGERLADAPVSKPTVVASASAWNKGNPVGRILKLCEDRGWQKKDAGDLCKEKFGDWQFSNLNHEQIQWLMETINTKTFLTAMAELKSGTKAMLKSNPPSSMFEEGDPGITEENLPF